MKPYYDFIGVWGKGSSMHTLCSHCRSILHKKSPWSTNIDEWTCLNVASLNPSYTHPCMRIKKNQTYLLYHTQTRTVRITDACMSLCLCASLALLCTISRFMCRQFETQGIVLVLTFFPWKPKNALHQPCFFSTDRRPLMKCKDRHLKPPKHPKAVPHTCCYYDVIFNS